MCVREVKDVRHIPDSAALCLHDLQPSWGAGKQPGLPRSRNQNIIET